MTNKEFVESIRALADFYEARPTLPAPYLNGGDISIFAKGKEEMAIAARLFGKSTKEVDDSFFRIKRVEKIGVFTLQALEYRSQICERVVVGRETVEIRVPDTFKTEMVTRNVVEWHCPKLLDDATVEEVA